jgi:GR25 family glycosyltransferase involved in LPS biosynthesis
MIDYFHDIHKEFPYTELYVYRGRDSFDKCPDLLEIMDKYDYIHYKGKVTQEILSDKFSKSDIWMYPCSFTETYCMSGLEALRGGCYCICNNLAALNDTIGDRGVIIKGSVKSNGIINKDTKQLFIASVRKALEDPKHKRTKQLNAIKWAKRQTWKDRAKEWQEMFQITDDNNESEQCDIGDWVCIPGSDSYGHDISYVPAKSVKQLKELASMMNDCVAFNSYGYFKKAVTNPSKWLSMPDIKLYVKRDIYNDIKANNNCVGPEYITDINPSTITELPTFYIINLPYREDRRQNITTRMNKYNINHEFVEAELKTSPMIDYYGWNGSHLNNMGKGYDRLAEFGCFASHLKAIRKFIDSGSEYGVIAEDDITLRKDFDRLLGGVMNTIPDQTPLVLLSVSNQKPFLEWDKTHGKPKENRINLIRIDRMECWGTLAYIISREYALKVIETYDKPFYLIDPNLLRIKDRVTSELITMNSKGYYTYPLLVLEELSKSDINDLNHIHHRRLFEWCGFDNYE